MTSIALMKRTQSQETNPMVSFDEEPIIAHLNDLDCNNSADNGDEQVLNENINFDYSLCCDDVNSPVDMSPLHMPLPISMTCMHIEENYGGSKSLS